MCETAFIYYGTLKHSGKNEFQLGNVGAEDDADAKEQLLRLYRKLMVGPDPEIVSVTPGYLQFVNVKMRYPKEK